MVKECEQISPNVHFTFHQYLTPRQLINPLSNELHREKLTIYLLTIDYIFLQIER